MLTEEYAQLLDRKAAATSDEARWAIDDVSIGTPTTITLCSGALGRDPGCPAAGLKAAPPQDHIFHHIQAFNAIIRGKNSVICVGQLGFEQANILFHIIYN